MIKKTKSTKNNIGYILVLCMVFVSCALRADVKMPAIFSDNMLLQQGKPVPVYGTADPLEKVTVKLCGQSKATAADAAGNWKVILAPLKKLATPTEMLIQGKNTITIKNVLVGDLWLASGQSNMEMRVREVNNAADEMKAADYPKIRFFMVPRDMASAPRRQSAGKWMICTPENVGRFSAAAYFFAQDIHASYKLPVGVINTAVGASACEAWVPKEILLADKFLPQPADIPAEEYPDWKTYSAVQQSVYDAAAHKDPGIKPECLKWAAPDYDASDWKEVEVPGSLESRGIKIDGAVWFRTEVDVPAGWVGRAASLYLGPITQNSIAYFNGKEIGRKKNNQSQWVFRTHTIPAELIKTGRNVVAVRIFNEINYGGFHPGYPAPLKVSQSGSGEVMLPKKWKCKVELSLEPAKLARILPYGYKVPSALYNAMIAPYTSTPLRGFLWYQGESNAGRSKQHDVLFPAMITAWRNLWGDETLPFYFVQLAAYRAKEKEPGNGGWSAFRESQTKTLSLPHTGMAIAIDIGDATNVHPKNKQDVGKRLARWAKRDCYGDKDTVVSGPIYKSSAVEGSRIRIKFMHVGGGLIAKGGELKSFAIADEDKKFVWAETKIEGDTVVVWNDAIPKPAYVRYAWANNPECTFYNAAGLPAVPFRTDK